jgi:prepilin-type N-terminal cleavage/methylation domain-containing protein
MRPAERLADERGMTIIELMVAMMILVVGVLSTIAVLDRSRALGDRSEAREVIAFQAQRELERVISYPFNRVGHRTLPTGTNVAGGAFRFDQDASPRSEPLISLSTAPAGSLALEDWETAWDDDQSRLSGWTRTYVTQRDPQTRRVTVMASVTQPDNGSTADDLPPVLVSTFVTDPRP